MVSIYKQPIIKYLSESIKDLNIGELENWDTIFPNTPHLLEAD